MQLSYYTIIHLFHVFIVGTLFLYVGIIQNKIPLFLYYVLFYLGIYVVIFHSYKAYLNIKSGKNPWVNLIHLFLVAPVLIYAGYYNTSTPSYIYQLFLLLGFASIGFHGYYLLF